MGAGAPKGNTNAEKWTLEEAQSFFDKAIEISEKDNYDFIGEVAKDLKQDKGVFDYLLEKFPENGFKQAKRRIKHNCEVNCFRNGKNGDIVPSLAIMNLKSNHGWTDRVDQTTKGKEQTTTNIINIGDGIDPKNK